MSVKVHPFWGGSMSPALPLPLVKVLSWVGDGSDTRVVAGVGFRPDLIILKSSTAGTAYFWHRLCWRGNAAKLGEATPHSAVVNGLLNDGFVVGAAANAAGVTYHAVVIADNGSGLVALGSYAGNGVDGRLIPLGFKPVYVAVKRDNYHYCWVCGAGMSASQPLQAAPGGDHIRLSAAGFIVGSSAQINEPTAGQGTGGEAYDYFALADCPAWRHLVYVGTGGDRDIRALPDPAFALIKSNADASPQLAQIVFRSMSGSAAITGAAEPGVATINDGALTLSSAARVNALNVPYSAIVFAELMQQPIDVSRPGLPAVRIQTDGGLIAPVRNAEFALNGTPLSIEVLFVYRATAPSTVLTLVSVNENNLVAGHHFGLQLSGAAHRSLSVQYKTAAGTQTNEIGFSPADGDVVHLGVAFDGSSEWLIAIDGRFFKRFSYYMPIAPTANPGNAKLTVGNRRSGADLVSPSFDCEDMSFLLWRLYGRELADAEWHSRYRRAVFNDLTHADVDPLDEWSAANAAGGTLFAAMNPNNNMTMINCAVEVV